MEQIKFGNWLITEEGIKWDSSIGTPYVICKDRLAECGRDDRNKMFDWLVHMPEKTWISKNEIYALNTAFIFALEYFDIGFPPELSFVDTFKEQQKLLNKR